MSCSGSLKKGRFGCQWQTVFALVGPIYDTSVESTIFAGTCIWWLRVCNSITGKCCCGRRRNSFKLSSKVWIYASPQLQLENICAALCIGLMLCWCCSQKVIKMSEMLQTHKTTFLLSWFLHLGRKQELLCGGLIMVQLRWPLRDNIMIPFLLDVHFRRPQVQSTSGTISVK